MRNANLATLDIDFIEANRYLLADPDARLEEGFDLKLLLVSSWASAKDLVA